MSQVQIQLKRIFICQISEMLLLDVMTDSVSIWVSFFQVPNLQHLQKLLKSTIDTFAGTFLIFSHPCDMPFLGLGCFQVSNNLPGTHRNTIWGPSSSQTISSSFHIFWAKTGCISCKKSPADQVHPDVTVPVSGSGIYWSSSLWRAEDQMMRTV